MVTYIIMTQDVKVKVTLSGTNISRVSISLFDAHFEVTL